MCLLLQSLIFSGFLPWNDVWAFSKTLSLSIKKAVRFLSLSLCIFIIFIELHLLNPPCIIVMKATNMTNRSEMARKQKMSECLQSAMKYNISFGENVQGVMNLHITLLKGPASLLTVRIISSIHPTRTGHCYLPFKKLVLYLETFS